MFSFTLKLVSGDGNTGGWFVWGSITVSVTVFCVIPAGMVNESGISVTSGGSAEIVTVVSALDAGLSVAVSVMVPRTFPAGMVNEVGLSVTSGESAEIVTVVSARWTLAMVMEYV